MIFMVRLVRLTRQVNQWRAQQIRLTTVGPAHGDTQLDDQRREQLNY
jgi:hypothetical protein